MIFKHKSIVYYSLIASLGLLFTFDIAAFLDITSLIEFELVLDAEPLYWMVICLYFACIVGCVILDNIAQQVGRKSFISSNHQKLGDWRIAHQIFCSRVAHYRRL